jgi:hypothetical protein
LAFFVRRDHLLGVRHFYCHLYYFHLCVSHLENGLLLQSVNVLLMDGMSVKSENAPLYPDFVGCLYSCGLLSKSMQVIIQTVSSRLQLWNPAL